MARPRIAITMGDVAGIGPEVIVRACAASETLAACRPIVVGDRGVLEKAVQLTGLPLRFVEVDRVDAVPDSTDVIPCWNPSAIDVSAVPPGNNDARAGRAAFDWLIAAGRAALAGEVDAITTAPLSKAALHLAGHLYPGHTEILAELCDVENFAMMLYVPPNSKIGGPNGLGVAHVTLHTSIASVPSLISPEKVTETIELLHQFLQSLGCLQPKIGVCALNPHAGEEGIFGDEEARRIAPGVRVAAGKRIVADGPIPADALMRRAVAGEFDGVVAMYHDQGHIALKLVAFDSAVNVTLGLPIVRTSPSQGTAFDIAWKGAARPDGMIGAIRTAAQIACTHTQKNEMGSSHE
ncbi:MAG: 4-hydroxythreonine-4-phosphate dehydrogenase PdxA [Planctomycetaceae bacterium]